MSKYDLRFCGMLFLFFIAIEFGADIWVAIDLYLVDLVK
jgi:hypothetical protein